MMYTTYANGGIIMAYQCIVVLTERLCQIVVLTGFLLVLEVNVCEPRKNPRLSNRLSRPKKS
jgi:hypothetical protein